MTYETLDWEVEARRLQKAFEIEGECELRQHLRLKGSRGLRIIGTKTSDLYIGADTRLRVTYETTGRYFYLSDKTQENWLSLKIGWNEDDIASVGSGHVDAFTLLLARASFYLGLLKPEVESRLQVTITAHQKMEWGLEFEERYL